MGGPHVAVRVVAVLLLAVPLPLAHATFTDPLPELAVAVTAAAAGPGVRVAGHAGGQVVAVDAATGANRWSVRLAGPVHDLAITSDHVVAAQGRNVIALVLGNGSVAWQHTASAAVVAVEGGDPSWAAVSDGRLLRLTHGAQVEELGTGLASLTDADVRDGRWAAAGPAGLAVQDGQGTLRLEGQFQRVRWTGPDGGLAVDAAGRLQRFDVGGTLSIQPADLAASVSALDGGEGAAVAGDASGLVHALDGAGRPLFDGLATYANSVLDVALWDGQAVTAFRGGWLGALRLEPAAVGLLLAPAEGDILPNPFVVRWAYADPDAEPGDQVRHRIGIRAPGGSWQTVASGFSPVDRLTRLREQVVDLASLPSGSPFDLRLELIDADGRLRTTGLGKQLVLDSEPPEPAGRIVPADGERVTTPRPLVGLGHRDRHSGVLGQLTEIVLDGEAGRVDWKSFPSFTEFYPSANLTDGPHPWQVTVQDRAGNRLVQSATFVVDTVLPTPGIPVVEAFLDTVLLRFATPEPASCAASAGPASAQDTLSGQHALALTGLAPDSAYLARITCRDAAGTAATRDVEVRTRPGGATDGVRLEVTIDPARPAGAGGFHTTTPRLSATATTTSATLEWSLDGAAAVPLPDPATIPDGSHNVLVLARAGDGSAAARSLHLDVDTTPPAAPGLTLDTGRRLVAWPAVKDEHSGIAALRLEGSFDGEWLQVLDLPVVAREATGLPADARQVRLVVRNGAGLESEGPALDLPAEDSDRLHSTASLQARQVAADGLVRVRLRLAPPDQSAEVVLVDANGVHRTFSDRVGIGTRTFEYSAPAAAFRPGSYDVRVRLAPSGTELGLGTLELAAQDVEAGNATNGQGRATRDTPSALTPILVAVVLGLAILQRRRA